MKKREYRRETLRIGGALLGLLAVVLLFVLPASRVQAAEAVQEELVIGQEGSAESEMISEREILSQMRDAALLSDEELEALWEETELAQQTEGVIAARAELSRIRTAREQVRQGQEIENPEVDREGSFRFLDGAGLPEEDGPAGEDAAEDLVGASAAKYKGIDVSEHNKTINWQKVKASGVKYVIIRCGYGMDQKDQDDDQWLANVRGCEKYGISYGVYLYSYATTWKRLRSEENHVLRLLKGRNVTLPVYLDMEDSAQAQLGSSTLQAFARDFNQKIRAAGYTPGIYASANYWTKKLPALGKEGGYSRWVAEYGSSVAHFSGTYQQWQYTSGGSVSGISGRTDLD